MLELRESKDERLLLSFLKGKTLERCFGGVPSGIDPADVIRNSKNVFLSALSNELPVGFVCLIPMGGSAYSIHLCLRTFGEKTKRIFALALQYARYHLNAISIYAIYPKSARAVTAIANYFQFKRDPIIEATLSEKFPIPYAFERLDLT